MKPVLEHLLADDCAGSAACACCGTVRHVSQFPRARNAEGTVRRSDTCLFCRQPSEAATTARLQSARVASPCDRCRLGREARS